MGRAIAVLVLLQLLGLITLGAATPQPITGKYLCSGTQGADRYSIALRIEAYEDTYVVQWVNSHNDPVLAGLAIHDGHELAVAILAPNGALGTAFYRLSPGVLEGKWTRGDGKVDTEICRKGDKVA